MNSIQIATRILTFREENKCDTCSFSSFCGYGTTELKTLLSIIKTYRLVEQGVRWKVVAKGLKCDWK